MGWQLDQPSTALSMIMQRSVAGAKPPAQNPAGTAQPQLLPAHFPVACRPAAISDNFVCMGNFRSPSPHAQPPRLTQPLTWPLPSRKHGTHQHRYRTSQKAWWGSSDGSRQPAGDTRCGRRHPVAPLGGGSLHGFGRAAAGKLASRARVHFTGWGSAGLAVAQNARDNRSLGGHAAAVFS